MKLRITVIAVLNENVQSEGYLISRKEVERTNKTNKGGLCFKYEFRKIRFKIYLRFKYK